MTKWHPLPNRLIVRLVDRPDRSESDLVLLPDDRAVDGTVREGVVVAVSPFSRNAKQREVPVTVHVGDCILFDARPGGVEEVGDLGVDGEVHYVMGEPAVLAVLED